MSCQDVLIHSRSSWPLQQITVFQQCECGESVSHDGQNPVWFFRGRFSQNPSERKTVCLLTAAPCRLSRPKSSRVIIIFIFIITIILYSTADLQHQSCNWSCLCYRLWYRRIFQNEMYFLYIVYLTRICLIQSVNVPISFPFFYSGVICFYTVCDRFVFVVFSVKHYELTHVWIIRELTTHTERNTHCSNITVKVFSVWSFERHSVRLFKLQQTNSF